jgi:hypothetical protein
MPTITDIEASAIADLAHSENIDSPGFISRPVAEALRVSDLTVRKLAIKEAAFSLKKGIALAFCHSKWILLVKGPIKRREAPPCI